MIESNRPTLLKLCWLISQQWQAELAYSRAQWRVSYYRKLKAKLETSKKVSEKWSDLTELSKKIETTRLAALSKQKHLLDTKKRLWKPMAAAKLKLRADFTTEDGKVIGVNLLVPAANGHKWQTFRAKEIAEMSDQYEAEKTLNKVLSNKSEVE